MTTEHIKTIAEVDGLVTTWCGKSGRLEMGGAISLNGRWTNATRSRRVSMISCKECAAAIEAAKPASEKPPTVYTKLRERLGREPSNRELIDRCCEEAERINRRGYSRAMNKAARDQAAIRDRNTGRAKK